ncbi:tRNA-specific 2-thiouridylase MnmA 1 [Bacteroidia bacterium]|nr:tRNA-specific 2-thiouridylase MnmA 1 [Bacteroidia bacterium]
MNVAALVSGGVDSSVVVYQLKQMGITPTIFYIRIAMENEEGIMECSSEEDIEITSFIAKKYGCKFEIVSLHHEYWDNVVKYTIDSVKRGLTPNPDVLCNKLIKFGSFEEKYGYDFDKIATGHYATTTDIDGVTFLSTAKDKWKDQTDFLAQLQYKQISRIMFPIGSLLKSEVRNIATTENLPSATRKDSQGICFLGKIDYNEFIRRFLGEKDGDIVEIETGKILGKHHGYWFHTIGQRKGLGLSGGPWYCVAKDIENNVVFASKGYDTIKQYGNVIHLANFDFISKNILGDMQSPTNIKLKIRHTPEFAKATIVRNSGQLSESKEPTYTIQSEQMLQGIAPGQFAVIYDECEHLCLGSGMISGNVG